MINRYTKFFLMMVMAMGIFSVNALRVGDLAPSFSLPDQDGVMRSLQEYQGKYVVLYFYPKDSTPGCTKQACSLRDNFKSFEENNISVIGINYDTPESHKAFKEKFKLPFTLLSDKERRVAKEYGAKNWFFIPLPCRMTFIIDASGVVRSILNKVDVSTHTQKILEIIRALKNPQQ